MSYSSIIGILLLIMAYVMFNTTHSVFGVMVKELSFSIGLLGGVGIGLIFGGFLGWLFKYRKLKKEDQKQEENQDKI
ncbi:hypothetical protein [Faecalibacter bovis]|uniref:DUF1049 domain-containing protein n=1 Tax=Faecalibacter bovis TaxID=2898187 RepID=A0ABX7XEP4_9FLAO|nr:hypothetical protein [Faecalibacter bovis]QTV06294.1 hypothetical protein J9309_02885 [Faecalibacter bovis]